jgi:Double zinc ribbon
MHAYSLRCPNCGKRVPDALRTCPACGAEQPFHIRRIRCGYCSRRVPANVTLCPYCRHNPRRMYLRPHLLWGLLGVGVLVALACAAFNAPTWVGGLAFRNAQTPTSPAPTRQAVLFVTATTSALATPSPTATLMHVITTNLATPTEPPTNTPTVTATATRPPLRVAPTNTPTATAVPLPPPLLLAPPNGAKLNGPHKAIVLSFHPTELRANEWYRVEVLFKDRENRGAGWCGWTKGTTLLFPSSYYDDSWQLDRTFRWHVQVFASSVDLPSTCGAPATPVGAPSADWVFYWF